MNENFDLEQFTTISDYVFHHAKCNPDGEALVWNGFRQSYAQFADTIEQISKALLARGIERGDRIAMLGVPRPEFMHLLMATTDIGAIWMGMHPRYQMPEFKHVVNLAKPRLKLPTHVQVYRELVRGKLVAARIDGNKKGEHLVDGGPERLEEDHQ